MLRLFGRLIVVLAAAAGGLIASQFPEFAQQYRQRLGGALDELHQIVADFDVDAERNRLTREAALDTYARSTEAFLRDRGVAMASTLARYEQLFAQKVRLEAVHPLMRPVVVLNQPDRRLLRGAWMDFEPAVPVTTAGLVWAALGFFIAGGFASAIRQIAGTARRRRVNRPISGTVQPSSADAVGGETAPR